MPIANKSPDLYVIHCFILIVIIGIVIISFFGHAVSPTADGVSGPANGFIWGYGLIALALFSVLFLTATFIAQATPSSTSSGASSGANDTYFTKIIAVLKSLFSNFTNVLSNTWTSSLTLGLVIWIIMLNMLYYTQINKGKVTADYKNFNVVITVMLSIQIILSFWLLTNKLYKTQYSISSSSDTTAFFMKFFIGLLGFINAIFIGFNNVFLQYYATDG